VRSKSFHNPSAHAVSGGGCDGLHGLMHALDRFVGHAADNLDHIHFPLPLHTLESFVPIKRRRARRFAAPCFAICL
jgi:hypothetical protein